MAKKTEVKKAKNQKQFANDKQVETRVKDLVIEHPATRPAETSKDSTQK
jgi:hypothetical protein